MNRLPMTFNASLAGAVRRGNAPATMRLARLAISCGMSYSDFRARALANDKILPQDFDELLPEADFNRAQDEAPARSTDTE